MEARGYPSPRTEKPQPPSALKKYLSRTLGFASKLASMVRRRPPLWLFLDPAAWLALMFSVWRLVLLVREMLAKPDDGRGILAQNDLARMAEALAEAEADIDWAIARRVRRLCGLDAGDVVRVVPAPAQTLQAFRARYDAQVRRVRDCTAIAERRAARMRRGVIRRGTHRVAPQLAFARLPEFRPLSVFIVRDGVQARAPPALSRNVEYALQV